MHQQNSSLYDTPNQDSQYASDSPSGSPNLNRGLIIKLGDLATPQQMENLQTAAVAHDGKSCKCGPSCGCRNPLVFPRRVFDLPPVQAALSLYEKVKTAHPALSCVLTAAEVGVLCSTVPMRLAAGPLRQTFGTPVYVADLVLCKGLDIAQRLFPCIAAPPSKTLRDFLFCACGLPLGICMFSCNVACRALRTCLCDIPAVAVGVPALAGCSVAQACLHDLPKAICFEPSKVVAKAIHTAVKDVESVVKDFRKAGELVAAQTQEKQGCKP